MKLHEVLSFVIGDDGGMHFQLSDAIRNMQKHGTSHKNTEVRNLCKKAAEQLKSQDAGSIYGGDPHTLLKVLAIFRGEPELTTLQGAISSLQGCSQTSDD